MKWFFLLLCIALSAPVWAEPTTIDEPLLSVYSTNRAENSRRAVRLGYQNFRIRFNTPDATFTDIQIASLITTGFQSFFDKLNKLDHPSDGTKITLPPPLNDEFQNLIVKLAKLLLKNQTRYTNPLFVDDEATAQETVAIVQEAVARGRF